MTPLALLAPSLDTDEATSSISGWEKQGEIEELFAQARRGEIPRYRELKSWEPATLNERHLQMILFRSTGLAQRSIAEHFGVTDANVSIVLNHPDSTYILDKLASLNGVDVTDMRKRMEGLLHPALLAIEEVLLDPQQDAVVKAKIGFGVFDRHYGKKTSGEIQHRHTVGVTKEAAGLLSRAISEAREIEDAEYTIVPSSEGSPEDAVPVTAAFAQSRAGGASTADPQEFPPSGGTDA